MQNICKNLKVIELASVLAGPAVGMFFAELGATVIKVENKKTGGDVTRNWRLPTEDKNAPVSAYYASVNYNKEVIFADLRDAEDKQKILDLIAEADIVVSNFRAVSARKLGLAAEQMRALNPRLIVAELSGYGTDDSRPAFDVLLQAEAGFLYMNGEADGNPVKMPVALIDILAAHQLKEGILLALLQRTQTGAGATVRVSLFEAAVASLANQASNHLMAGHIPQRMGTLHPNIAPYGEMFACADGKPILLASGTEKHFENLCKVLGVKSLAQDERFATNALRVQNRWALQAELSPHFEKKNRAEWLRLFAAASVPAGEIRNLAEVFQEEKARKMILEETANGQLTRRVRTAAFEIIV